ncbi:MAG: hypothetical protein IPJ25_09215 [Rhodocyclaceae bacterium]|nr:hypothetical protein [Rhodocyclaceae bacterium]
MASRDGAERVFCATALSLVVFDFALVSSAPTEKPTPSPEHQAVSAARLRLKVGLTRDQLDYKYRGKLPARGNGDSDMYFVLSENKSGEVVSTSA